MRQVRKEEWCRFLRTSYLRRAVWGSLSSAHGTRALPSSLTTLLTLGQKLLKSFHLVRFQNGLNPLQSFSSNDSMPLVGFLVDVTKLLATFLKNPAKCCSLRWAQIQSIRQSAHAALWRRIVANLLAPARCAFRKREPRLGPKEDQSSPKQDTDSKNKQYQEGGLAATVQGMSPSTDSSPRESTTSSTENSSGTGSSKKIAAYSSSTGSASVTL